MECFQSVVGTESSTVQSALAVRRSASECHDAGFTPTLWTGMARESIAPSRNSRCVVSSAARTSSFDTTKEMLHSEEPCAIAMMFRFSRPEP